MTQQAKLSSSLSTGSAWHVCSAHGAHQTQAVVCV